MDDCICIQAPYPVVGDGQAMDLQWISTTGSNSKVFPTRPPPLAQDQNVPHWTSTTTSSESGCSPPDLQHMLRIKVLPTRRDMTSLLPQAQNQVVPCQTSTTILYIKTFLTRPPPQAQDQSVPHMTATTTSSESGCSSPDLHRKLRIKVFPT